MNLQKSFLIAGILSGFAAFSLLFVACPLMPKDEPVMTVTIKSNADKGQGSLRDVIDKAPDGGTIIIDPSVKTIALSSRLPVNRSVTIDGNGVTITRATSWIAVDDDTHLMHIGDYNTVTIRRVHFKGGKTTANGAAIYNNGGDLTLESCIFSENRARRGSSAIYGVRNYSDKGSLNVRGCTFYGNSVETWGGAIHLERIKLTLEGSLFYRNTTDSGYSVMSLSSGGSVTSGGYNVIDVAYGTGYAQAGWDATTGDKVITVQPVSPITFRLLPDSEAAGIITLLPGDYPTKDFYGKSITAPASAGAVQSTASEGGYILETTVNNAARGSVNVIPPPNTEGLYSGMVTVTATPAERYGFSYWLVDGTNAGETNPLRLTVTDHTQIQAVFTVIIVNKFTDASGSALVQGTLRYALINIQNGEIIRLSNVTPGQTVIELTSRLPDIYRNITIEGNGVTITRDATWTTENNDSQLMYINSGTVTISRIHFRDGRATNNGAAIRIDDRGDLTLESCIFSGNQTSSRLACGGAIYTRGNLNVKGCTFYENNSVYQGGAIYAPFGVTITLTGNLFYKNTSEESLIVYNSSFSGATVTSAYNVVDVAYGTGDTQAGWNAGTGDKTFTELGISGTPIDTGTFRPVSGLGSVVLNPSPESFPATDFYGETRTFPGAPGAVR